jgi:hypothetical protein
MKMKWIVVVPVILILLLPGCGSAKVNSRCDALKIAENNIPAAITARVSAVAADFDGQAPKDTVYFVDFTANNVTFADLGPGWAIVDSNRAQFPGDTYNLLTIRIDKETGKIVSKTAGNGYLLGPQGKLPDCGK